MATFINSVTQAKTPAETAGFIDRIVGLAVWIGERRARSATLRELERLNRRTLEDLQIAPYDFNSIADGTFRR